MLWMWEPTYPQTHPNRWDTFRQLFRVIHKVVNIQYILCHPQILCANYTNEKMLRLVWGFRVCAITILPFRKILNSWLIQEAVTLTLSKLSQIKYVKMLVLMKISDAPIFHNQYDIPNSEYRPILLSVRYQCCFFLIVVEYLNLVVWNW